MPSKSKIIILLALMALPMMLSGCFMTKKHFEVLDDKLNTIRNDQKEIAVKVNYLDSLIGADAEESIKLKAELSSAVKDLLQQFQTTQVNLNDVQEKLDQLLKNPNMAAVFMQPLTVATTDSAQAGSTVVDIAPTMLPAVDCQNLYDESFISIRGGQYEEAISGFTDYLEFCTPHGQADNARFWIGEAYYSMNRYPEAISEFDLLLRSFADSEKRASAMYKMARSHEELGQLKDAIDIFKQIVEDFPGSIEAQQAEDKVTELEG